MSLDREDQDDDLLTKLLRDTAPDPVPDEGFADAIMTRLPPRRPRPHRAVWLGAGFRHWVSSLAIAR
jgi:hypothetical protein